MTRLLPCLLLALSGQAAEVDKHCSHQNNIEGVN
jgi:hypothetical protein